MSSSVCVCVRSKKVLRAYERCWLHNMIAGVAKGLVLAQVIVALLLSGPSYSPAKGQVFAGGGGRGGSLGLGLIGRLRSEAR